MLKTEENKLVRHHISYNPPKTEKISLRSHEKIHDNLPIINELNLKMRQYDKLVKLSVMIKNWAKAYEREFGEVPIDLGLSQIERKKKEILKGVRALVKVEFKEVKHIKGVGLRYLAGLLAHAHPNRFSTLHRYLYYCGYTGASKITKKYSRKVCGLVFQIVQSLIIHKDEKYYPLYLRIKQKQPSDFSKIKKHRIAMNRVGTIFLKEFYEINKGQKTFK